MVIFTHLYIFYTKGRIVANFLYLGFQPGELL